MGLDPTLEAPLQPFTSHTHILFVKEHKGRGIKIAGASFVSINKNINA